MHDCGDGVLNETAFEECDYARSPAYGVDLYQRRKDIFYLNGNYFTCSKECKAIPIDLCGDGM